MVPSEARAGDEKMTPFVEAFQSIDAYGNESAERLFERV